MRIKAKMKRIVNGVTVKGFKSQSADSLLRNLYQSKTAMCRDDWDEHDIMRVKITVEEY